MAIIYSYQKNTVILPTDILLGTTTKILNGKPKNQTKSFTISDLSNYINDGYATESWVTSNFYPLNENPAGYLTNEDLPVPTLQQVTTEGNTTIDGIIINTNTEGEPSSIVSNTGIVSSLYSLLEQHDARYTYYDFELSSEVGGISYSTYGSPGTLYVSSFGGLENSNYTGLANIQSTDGNGSAYLTLQNKNSWAGWLKVTNLTNNVTLQFPNKATGTYTIATTADIGATPTLQQVTDAGNVSTTPIYVGTFPYITTITAGTVLVGNNSTNQNIQFSPTQLDLKTRIGGGFAMIKSDYLATVDRVFQFPDQTGTLALTSDIPIVGTWGALNYPTWTTGTPFVKMTAVGTFALDTNTYLTSITSSNVTTALGYTPVTNARTLTINGTAYDLTANRSWNVGTVTSVAALTLGTTGLDLSSSVATGTTTPVITLNVPTASATNRGALSSTDWSTFNNKQTATSSAILSTLAYYNYKNTTSSSTLTGTLTETQLLQVTIPANTFSASDFLKFTATFVKTGIVGVCNLKFKISTSSTMPSGSTSQIATVQMGTTSLFGQINRTLSIKSSNITGYNFTVSAFTDNVGSTSAINTQAFDPTVTNYFYVSATLLSAADSVYMNSIQITNI